MSYFMSGSGENKVVTPKLKGKKSIRFKEDVAKALVELHDVPMRTAEVAVIDLRYEVNLGLHGKLTPEQTAATMIQRVKEVFRLS